MSAAFESAEHGVFAALQWLKLGIETTGAVWLAVGAMLAFGALVRAHARGQTTSFLSIRLQFSRYLSLALEFQLAADILSTAVAPTWAELGKLGATATIRTALNYFLSKEIQEGKAEVSQEEQDPAGRAGRGGEAPARELVRPRVN
jgi:uncharacterized membrane protein